MHENQGSEKYFFSDFAWKKHGLAGAKQQEFASKNESDERALVTILILEWGWGANNCCVHPIFRFFVTFGNEVKKMQKYYVIFVYILQGKMGKMEKNGKTIMQLK